ncbi:MAG: hypothetical protein AMXMBFR7_46960 [Planctomycetota bacterium]
MLRNLTVCLIGALALTCSVRAQDLIVAPEKVAQLKRVEPLSADKLNIFVTAGAISASQRDLLLKHIDAQGRLNLPERYQGPEPAPAPLESRPAPVEAAPVAEPAVTGGVLGWIVEDDKRWRASLDRGRIEHFKARVAAFRSSGVSERSEIRRELAEGGGEAVLAIASFYTDPVDIGLKLSLWRAVAKRSNPHAVGYIAETHKMLMREANAILVPYDKDAGFAVFRRKQGREAPYQVGYTSRELREIILDLEACISNCSGVRAATYLMDLYAARYEVDAAPMRDDDRDRKRMVFACGGNSDHFDQDEPGTWSCVLQPFERVLIADRLAPHLQARDKDTRKIAANGMMIALDVHKKIKDFLVDKAHEDWNEFERWFNVQRGKLTGR